MTDAKTRKPSDTSLPPAIARAVDECWERAIARWTSFLLLSRPKNDGLAAYLARIDLGTREIYFNGERILERNLLDCVEALTAHEIGHHVRHPGTLVVEARLQLLERQLIPIEGTRFSNLFTDLLINERLGETLREPMVKLYRSFHAEPTWGEDTAFLFYLAIYEELWGLSPGTLIGDARLSSFTERFPGYRGEAHVMSQDLFRMGPNLYTQFLYFVSVLSLYIALESGAFTDGDPVKCSCGDPSPEDWAEAMEPCEAEREAIERAARARWISEEQARRLTGTDVTDRRIASLPGRASANAEHVPQVMAAFYRQQAERYLIRPPPRRTLGEATVPTVLQDWESGDAVSEIDWPATLRLRGKDLSAVQPLRRERTADYQGLEIPEWSHRAEIYLDVSGSMPDPRISRNAMTLAAQILAAGTIRGGGFVRAALYSWGVVRYWRYGRSEAELSRFLMQYIGGGTRFPFLLLRESLRECASAQPIRIVITDSDFDCNYHERPENALIFADAARLSSPLVLLQHRPNASRARTYRGAGAEVVAVPTIEDFPRLASDLAKALFAERAR